jgi:hypothetical protein
MRGTLPAPLVPQHQAASAAAAPASAPVAPEGEFQDASRGDSQAAVRGRNPRQPSEPASKSGTGAKAEEAANIRPIGRPKKDCYGLTIWLQGHLRGTAVKHKGIGTHEGEAVWQGEDEWEEGVGVKRTKLQRLRI